MTSCDLYRIDSTPNPPNSPFSVTEIDDSLLRDLPGGLTSMTNYYLNGHSYLTGFEMKSGTIHTFTVHNKTDNQYFTPVATSSMDGQPESIAAFYIAGSPWLLTYNPASEYAVFYSVEADFSVVERYQAKIGEGFSTVQPFAYRFGIYFVAYAIKTGQVRRFQLSVPGQDFLHAELTWSDLWAHGWTHFSFFQNGGENYFIKTNIDYHKVNIDHFMDDATEGSHPVCDIPVPDQMKGLQNVEAFVNLNGDSYFATYRSNGEMTFNKFYGNILGWTKLMELNSTANADLLQALTVKDTNYMLLYTA